MKFEIDGPGLILTLLATGAISTVVSFRAVESYVPFYPTIDTVLPPEFSEANFYQVQRGTDKETVLALLGNPNGVRSRNEGSNVWVYGSDGACLWWDFAWIEYRITFDGDDRVSTTNRQVYYD